VEEMQQVTVGTLPLSLTIYNHLHISFFLKKESGKLFIQAYLAITQCLQTRSIGRDPQKFLCIFDTKQQEIP
jgi:hypothetical protein